MASVTEHEFLSKLLERRAELSREALALDALIAHYQRLAMKQTSESRDLTGQLDLYGRVSPRHVKAAEIARVVDIARKMILAANRPMKRGELAAALLDQGIDLPGKDKNKVLGTNLWRSGKFRTVDDMGYWPKDTPLPRR